jgi:hypothetical protein
MTRRLFGEFVDPHRFLGAIASLRGEGHQGLEAYAPYPLHGLDAALGAPPSRLPRVVFAVGLAAAAGAYGLEWLLDAYLYPLDVGGRPAHFPFAFVPISFEMGVLFAGFAAFFGVLWLGRLGRLWQPIFEVERIESVTRDGFWLELAANDPALDLEALAERLRQAGAVRVTVLDEVTS